MRLATSSISSPAVLAGTLLLLVSYLPSASATCYYPNGDTANDVPCNSETDESTCCGTGYACFGISSQYYLCKSTGDEIQKAGASTYVRGSCTDKTWRSGNCPSVCVDPDRDDVSGGNGVAQCPNSDSEFYCISSGLGVANCSTGYELIDFASTPTALTTIGVLASTTSSSSSSSTSTSSKTSSSLSSASTTASSSTATDSSSSSGAGSTKTDGPVEHKSSVGVDVGATLGAVAGVAIIGVGAWFLIRRRNRQKAERAAAAAVASGGSPGGPGGAGGAYLSPDMSHAPVGYAPTPNYGVYPPSSTSPQPPSELYDAPYGSNKNTSYSGSPPPNQHVVNEMPTNESRYEMA